MLFVEVIDVPRPPAAVHAYVADFKNLPRWDPTIIRVEQTSPDPVAAGTTYVVVLEFLGSETTMHYVVKTFEPPARAVLEGKSESATAIDTVEIEPTSDGSRLTWRAEIDLAWPGKLLAPLLKLLFRPSVREAVANLRARLLELPEGVPHRDGAVPASAGRSPVASRARVARYFLPFPTTSWMWL
jgi:carbon monoxide dehydrogenase subunit G